jgi:hypothetical protein
MQNPCTLEIELREPHTIFEGLDADELRELQGDIGTYQDLEGEGSNREFWRALDFVCQKELDEASGSKLSAGVHSAVMEELKASFSGKSSADLEVTRTDIQSKLDQNDGSLDLEFWEAVLDEVRLFRAKADIKDFHQQKLRQWLAVIERKQLALRKFQAENPTEALADETSGAAPQSDQTQSTLNLQSVDTSPEANAMMLAEKERGLGDLEEELGLRDEVSIADKFYWWQDKYRPRKPRYFNRVRTG